MKRLPVALMVAAAFMLVTATAGQAGNVQKATGSIVMSNPWQAAEFAAFDSDPAKGNMSYTNFEASGPGSGVWVPQGTFDVGFGVDPSPTVVATYHFAVTSWTPTSSTSLEFAGVGDGPDPWYGDFEGSIDGSEFEFTLLETNGSETYTLTATGTIDGTGAVAGTWSDNYAGVRTGTFVIADVGSEVLHFEAPVLCADSVSETEFVFGLHIPDVSGSGIAADYNFFVKVTDGGSPGSNDTYRHYGAVGVGDLTTCAPGAAWYGPYPIMAGNLTVFA